VKDDPPLEDAPQPAATPDTALSFHATQTVWPCLTNAVSLWVKPLGSSAELLSASLIRVSAVAVRE
jgi:hypothetical protein